MRRLPILLALAVSASLIAGTGVSASAATTSTCAQGTVRPEAFGAYGDNKHDDTLALQKALSSVKSGNTVCLSKSYRHSSSLNLTASNVTVTGGGSLISTNPVSSSFEVTGNKDTISNVSLISNATTRYTDIPQMKLAILNTTGTALSNVIINGSSAAGVFVANSSHFTASNVSISHTMADGFTMTGGSSYGTLTNIRTQDTGDDGVSTVSYVNEPITHDISVSHSSVNGQSWGRGMTVVGGKNVSYTDDTISSSAGAALYVGSEPKPNNTQGTYNVTLSNIDIYNANWNQNIAQGAVLLYAGNPGFPIQGTAISNVAVHSQFTYASRAFGKSCDGTSITGTSYTNAVSGQPGVTAFWSDCE